MASVALLTIGDEILYGQILNTNVHWLSIELDKAGFSVALHLSVGDTAESITKGLDTALAQASIVLITGGLGPTKDDVTKHTLAAYFQSELAIHEQALADVTVLVTSRGRSLNELNRLQALQPVKARYIKNEVGTAPGMWFDAPGGKVVVSMPGVPFEMKRMVTNQVLPLLNQQFEKPVVLHKYACTIGCPESELAQLIEPWETALPPYLKLAYLPTYSQVKLRLTGRSADAAALEAEMNEQIAALVPIIGQYIYAFEEQPLEQALGKLLCERKLTVAAAESCTGGQVATTFTSIPGSSEYFQGGVVAYSKEVKVQVLGVKPETLAEHGVYSHQCAAEMAAGVREKLGAAIGLSTTGVAGPASDDPNVPVGNIWIGLAHEGGVDTRQLTLGKDRETNIKLTTMALLNLLRKHLVPPAV